MPRPTAVIVSLKFSFLDVLSFKLKVFLFRKKFDQSKPKASAEFFGRKIFELNQQKKIIAKPGRVSGYKPQKSY
jgi:hypothetical protein